MACARPGLRLAPPPVRPAERLTRPRLRHAGGVASLAAPQTRRREGSPATPDETILQNGRAKAYRPLPEGDRRRAFEAGLTAYANGDFFEAHELWEPAWMGTRDLAERELLQGLIKLAAAFVHQVRGNPRGVEKNLRGARARIAAGESAGPVLRVDVRILLASIDTWLETPGDDPIVIPSLPATGS